MPTTIRSVTTCAAVLLCGVASAQVETAPRPHLALDEVVKEYRRLGLRLPPPGAELVSIERFVKDIDADANERPHPAYHIGFKLAPIRPGKDPRYLIGHGRFWNWWIDPARVKPAEPTPDALSLVFMGGDDFVCFAVQCKLRGWHDLAQAAYARGIEFYATVFGPDGEWDVLEELQGMAWWEWAGQLSERGSDRKEILKQLKKLADEYEHLRNPANGYLLSCIESTLAPRKSKPGTVESLIDDLTEYWGDEDRFFHYPTNPAGKEAYWKLVELGFDAVPALIDHLNDDRLSRACVIATGTGSWTYRLTVGHLCSRLLFDLSARTIGGRYWAARGDRLDPAKAGEWFAGAQKFGEERWLLDHAIPEGDPQVIVNQTGRPERLIVRVIGARYPARLPAIYRAMLKKAPSGWNDDYVDEIRESKLPYEQKLALFEEGLTHDDIGHRIYALQGLAGLDKPLLRKHLLKTLNEVATRRAMGKPWSLNAHRIVPLVAQAGDRECWDALATAAKKATADDRVDVILALHPYFPPDEDDPIRRERLRFLIQFLDDRSLESGDEPDEVGDYAAHLLAKLLRFPVDRDPEFFWGDYHERGSAFSRLLIREAVRQAAARELARDK